MSTSSAYPMDPALAILIRFPNSHSGIVSRENIPMSMPKMPNGSAAPRSSTQPDTKKVQANEMMARRIVTMTKQSAARWPYESMSYR